MCVNLLIWESQTGYPASRNFLILQAIIKVQDTGVLYLYAVKKKAEQGKYSKVLWSPVLLQARAGDFSNGVKKNLTIYDNVGIKISDFEK